ncbi:MAG: hypothetical protein A2511_12205 [Deltaproteobacteria bacterium RIFOXYD12_FULL_50_9]|nr:MAG: hypothetical protein A2511_12205 [Deltaproteobacteria bacterium RIFOXYD12_FULL_50_9]
MNTTIISKVRDSQSGPSNEDHSAYIKWLKNKIKKGELEGAFHDICEFVNPRMDYSLQFKVARLIASIDLYRLGLKPIKIALVSTSSIEHFTDILKLWMAVAGYQATIYASKFDTVFQTILDAGSDLYKFEPDYVWIFCSYRDYSLDISPGDSDELITKEIQRVINKYKALWQVLRKNSSSFIIHNNADIPINTCFGNLDGAESWGRINCLRRINVELSSNMVDGATIFDVDSLSNLVGKSNWFDPRFWYHSKHAFSMDAYGVVASKASWVIKAAEGRSKKCIVLDLDNTIWGGVIGDDGVEGISLGASPSGEAYVDFQRFIRELKNRGIILAVCSKNDEEIAKQPFIDHPNMCLRLDDIAVFVANWNNKADNIKEIASSLNIGLDSLVFVDDNPVEREQVRANLPMVAVPELPDDPAGYIAAIADCGYFESVSFTSEDKIRNTMYRQNVERKELQNEFSDLSSFLQSLSMISKAGEITLEVLPRVSQLINKSNQFHLTTTRYSESDIQSMLSSNEYVGRFFTLQDKFGDNGLISVIILKRENKETLIVDTWVMSCRVLSRSMEKFIHREVVGIAKMMGVMRLVGRYIPSPKNKLVSGLYKELGFSLIDDVDGVTTWEFDVKSIINNDSIFINYA